MKNKRSFSIAIAALASGLLLVLMVSFAGYAVSEKTGTSVQNQDTRSIVPAAPVGKATVYFTSDISPAGLEAVYKALDRKAEGKVAVKVHTGEPGGHNFLQPALIKDLVQSVSGTIVECNTAYPGSRINTAMHKQVAKDHGFTAIAPVDIMDEEGSVSLPFPNGKNIKEDFVGSHFKNYDFFIVLSHFKGHAMGGFGGAIKNMPIGIASSEGKAWIHSAGKSREIPTWSRDLEQDPFLESMAEAAGAVRDSLGDRVVYISVMNRLSVDCDCTPNPAEPDMHDIGVLASLDPVALDQACVDLVYAAPDGKSLVERMESMNGMHTLAHAEAIGLGSRQYDMISVD
jgi:uncharacterized Fe-S center protein